MPQDLSDPTESLIGQFATGSLHHGLLFLGQRLQSIESQAMNLTRSVLGMSEEQNMHPDLFHLRPSGKARIIVEKTRALISELNRSSNQGGGKVAFIHEADRMRKEAANAFLKTLEEPPSGTYLILMTTRPYSMLATIRSRCLLVRLKGEQDMKTSEDWQEWLKSLRIMGPQPPGSGIVEKGSGVSGFRSLWTDCWVTQNYSGASGSGMCQGFTGTTSGTGGKGERRFGKWYPQRRAKRLTQAVGPKDPRHRHPILEEGGRARENGIKLAKVLASLEKHRITGS